jgi:riboflavin biosynthesis pyrimidine reductase
VGHGAAGTCGVTQRKRNVLRADALAAFAHRKEHAATRAAIERFCTLVDNAERHALDTISTEFTDALLDGPFYQSPVAPGEPPSVNLVFVQSRDGNTEADDPSTLGGGETDKHVIYEGLSRVAADAVLAGSRTVGDGELIFSVWHPALVELRHILGKPRHPIQVVLTAKGRLPIEKGLMFNAPDVPVIVLADAAVSQPLADRARSRPWITVVNMGHPSNIREGIERLGKDFAIHRISAIGGRSAATALITAGLVRDLYLTTSAVTAGHPDTPMYIGTHPPQRELIVRKQSQNGVVFEHFLLQSRD